MAVENHMLSLRALEEIEPVESDIASAVIHFTDLFNITNNSEIVKDDDSCINAFRLSNLDRLFSLMTVLWKTAGKHLEEAPTLPHLSEVLFNDDSDALFGEEISADLDDDDSDCD